MIEIIFDPSMGYQEVQSTWISGPGCNGNEGGFSIKLESSSLTIRCSLISYPGHYFARGVLFNRGAVRTFESPSQQGRKNERKKERKKQVRKEIQRYCIVRRRNNFNFSFLFFSFFILLSFFVFNSSFLFPILIFFSFSFFFYFFFNPVFYYFLCFFSS